MPSGTELARILEAVYADCHDPVLIDPDPLLVVRGYSRPADLEIAGLFCAAFALGRASAIVSACRRALGPFGPRLFESLASMPPSEVFRRLDGFSYRFFDARDAAGLLCAAAALSRAYGSLEAAFLASPAPVPCGPADPYSGGPSARLLSRCDAFVDLLRAAAAAALDLMPADGPSSASARLPSPLARNLLPAPRDGSACKRLMLFLRWMVRGDAIDLGLWPGASPAELVLPLDVHLHRIARALGMTARRSADLRAALEVTRVLRSLDPLDPVKYDFALSRLGIRSDYSLKQYFSP